MSGQESKAWAQSFFAKKSKQQYCNSVHSNGGISKHTKTKDTTERQREREHAHLFEFGLAEVDAFHLVAKAALQIEHHAVGAAAHGLPCRVSGWADWLVSSDGRVNSESGLCQLE